MKHVLITGGTDGLGKYLAEQLVLLGHTVTILGRSEEKTRTVATAIGASYVVADVTEYEAVAAAVNSIHTPIDILINNAGVWTEGPYDLETKEDIERTMMVNTMGTMYTTRLVLPELKKQGSGEIINIISDAGRRHKAERATYGASKWAITGFTLYLRDELDPLGIAVSAAYPGKFISSLFKKVGVDKDFGNAITIKEVAAPILAHIQAGMSSIDILYTE